MTFRRPGRQDPATERMNNINDSMRRQAEREQEQERNKKRSQEDESVKARMDKEAREREALGYGEWS